jgi:hypothetical protein
VHAIDLPDRRGASFALSAALSAQADADSRMEHSAQQRLGTTLADRFHNAMGVTPQPNRTWAFCRQNRNADSGRR